VNHDWVDGDGHDRAGGAGLERSGAESESNPPRSFLRCNLILTDCETRSHLSTGVGRFHSPQRVGCLFGVRDNVLMLSPEAEVYILRQSVKAPEPKCEEVLLLFCAIRTTLFWWSKGSLVGTSTVDLGTSLRSPLDEFDTSVSAIVVIFRSGMWMVLDAREQEEVLRGSLCNAHEAERDLDGQSQFAIVHGLRLLRPGEHGCDTLPKSD